MWRVQRGNHSYYGIPGDTLYTPDARDIRGIPYIPPALAVLFWLGCILLGVSLIGQILDRDHARAEYQQHLRQRIVGRVAR